MSFSPSPLITAVKAQNTTEVKRLLSEGADPTTKGLQGFTALHEAAYLGNRHLVSLLMTDERVNLTQPNDAGSTAALVAFIEGHDEITTLINTEAENREKRWSENRAVWCGVIARGALCFPSLSDRLKEISPSKTLDSHSENRS
jgi:ankyrin repeat protein